MCVRVGESRPSGRSKFLELDPSVIRLESNLVQYGIDVLATWDVDSDLKLRRVVVARATDSWIDPVFE